MRATKSYEKKVGREAREFTQICHLIMDVFISPQGAFKNILSRAHADSDRVKQILKAAV